MAIQKSLSVSTLPCHIAKSRGGPAKTLELENIAVRADDEPGIKSPLFPASEPIMWLQVVTIKFLFR